MSAVANLPRGPLLKRGDTVTLLCNVSVVTTGPAQVEVQWLQRAVLPAQEGGATVGGVVIEKGGDKPSVEEKGRVLASLTYEGLSRPHKNHSSEVIGKINLAVKKKKNTYSQYIPFLRKLSRITQLNISKIKQL